MTRAEFIKLMSKKVDYMTSDQVDRAVRSTLNAIINGLNEGERVEIRNFGCFSTKFFEARQGINPRTGEIIDLPPRRTIHFKAGKGLKYRINKDKQQ